jgi:hypothetical protein
MVPPTYPDSLKALSDAVKARVLTVVRRAAPGVLADHGHDEVEVLVP